MENRNITIRGQFKISREFPILKWYDNSEKKINSFDFEFMLKESDFFEKFKYIQDNNDLNYLKIIRIENPIYYLK